MVSHALAALFERRPVETTAPHAARTEVTRQDIQAFLREELDRMRPLSC